ncbi:MAG: D-2-hydroxyacid dehydrogenase [Alphaproteobacteria bacterium]|nr:D-2-hydroxyacid dehydrogenase [Alphaproteobacteria bacterium]
MSFRMVLLPPDMGRDWPDKIRRAVPGVEVTAYDSPAAAANAIVTADAAYGTVPRDLLARAKRLRWIAAPRAGLGGDWFYDELVNSPVVVTNLRGIYNESLAHHIMGFVLAFAHRFDHYLPQQRERAWKRGPGMLDLTHMTALIVGVGGAGAEAARLCAAFGMRVVGVDPRVAAPPAGMAELVTPDALDARLGEADFVILTVPESPQTLRLFDAGRFAAMKRRSYFINIGRGACVVTDDLVAALMSGHLAGAGLDVVTPEPLPPEHPLWTMQGVLLTPHVAILGTPYQPKREAILLENCQRFARGEALLNVVDKASWF